jgi:hypothetical protein
MDLIHNLSIGFGVAFTFTNLLYCLRHPDRRAARPRPDRHHRHAAAGDLCAAARWAA